MKKLYILYISIPCFIIGMLSVMYMREWIIIRWPSKPQAFLAHPQQISKQKIVLHYWQANTWRKETTDILWSEDKAENITRIVRIWLNLIDEEHAHSISVTLQTVMLAHHDQCAYLSFDRNPIIQNQSTMTTILWFEGLLKTLRENNIELDGVYFLVHHQELTDYRLDFSHPWPLSGFLQP